MATCAPRLEVGEKRFWSDVSVKILRVSELPQPRVFDARFQVELTSTWNHNTPRTIGKAEA